MCNLSARIKRWASERETVPGNLKMSVKVLIAKLVSIGYLRLTEDENGQSKVTLQIDRGRFIIFLNRIMMLDVDDQKTLIDLVHNEIKLMVSTKEATEIANLRGIFGKWKTNYRLQQTWVHGQILLILIYMFYLFFMYTEVDPLTTVRSMSCAASFHSAFGRKWKVQEFMRSRLADWKFVLERLAEHEESIRDCKYKHLYKPKFLRLEMTEGMPEDVVLELPQSNTEDPYTPCCVYIAPFNRKGTRSVPRHFRKENFKVQEIQVDEAKQLWDNEHKWFDQNQNSCIHEFT